MEEQTGPLIEETDSGAGSEVQITRAKVITTNIQLRIWYSKRGFQDVVVVFLLTASLFQAPVVQRADNVIQWITC